MKDKIGKIPKIKSHKHALEEILKISKDKRCHVLLDDENEWLELKIKAIWKIAKKGLTRS